MNNVNLLIKVEGTDEYLDDALSEEQVSIYMGADVLTYSCFGEYDLDTDYEVVSRKYKSSKNTLTIVIRKIKETSLQSNTCGNKFKVIFLESKTNNQIIKGEYGYEEIVGMLNSGKVFFKVEEKAQLYRIVDKFYKVDSKGLAIFLKEIDLDEE